MLCTKEIDDDDGVVSVALTLLAVIVILVEKESCDIRRKDGRVDDQEEDNPVPYGLEGRVVEDGPFVDPGRLQLVLGQDISAQ